MGNNNVVISYDLVKRYVENYKTSGRKHTIVIPPAKIKCNDKIFYFSEIHNRYYDKTIDSRDVWYPSRMELVLRDSGIDFKSMEYEILVPEKVVVRIPSKSNKKTSKKEIDREIDYEECE